MARIDPFRGVCPTRDKVSLVSTRSYEEYPAAELACQLQFNPLSFLHVLHPAYAGTHYADNEKRFRIVHQKFREFFDDGLLERDENPCFYIHRIINGDKIFTGIIAATSIEDYKSQVIKRHEETIRYRVEFFKDYMKYSGFNTEPVLMTYGANERIAGWLEEHTTAAAHFEFSTKRREKHQFWKISNTAQIARLKKYFEEVPALYIADGHHRSASSEMLYDETAPFNANFMSYLIAEQDLRICAFHRLVRDLNGLDAAQFVKRLSDDFLIEIQNRDFFVPKQQHEFGMYLEEKSYSLRLRPEKHSIKNPLDSLDSQILFEKILLPILGIHDLRNDERIEYMPANKPVLDFQGRFDDGNFKVGFLLYPCPVSLIRDIADAGLVMPPKSTYIEPKLRSGLIIHEF